MRIILDGCIVDSREIINNGERWLSSISQIALYQPIEFHIIFHSKIVEFLFNLWSIQIVKNFFSKFYTELFITMLFINWSIILYSFR